MQGGPEGKVAGPSLEGGGGGVSWPGNWWTMLTDSGRGSGQVGQQRDIAQDLRHRREPSKEELGNGCCKKEGTELRGRGRGCERRGEGGGGKGVGRRWRQTWREGEVGSVGAG